MFFVPYVIRENVPLGIFHILVTKKISTTHLVLLTQCRWSEPQMKEVKVSKVMQVWVRSRRDDAIISRLLLSLSNYYTCQYMRAYFFNTHDFLFLSFLLCLHFFFLLYFYSLIQASRLKILWSKIYWNLIMILQPEVLKHCLKSMKEHEMRH